MNKSNIEWCDYTLNPIVGCTNSIDVCPIRDKCYARKQSKRMYNMNPEKFTGYKDFSIPKFYPERLKELSKVKSGSKIFIGSMADMWCNGIKIDWIREVLIAYEEYLLNKSVVIQFLTKNIKRYIEIEKYVNKGISFHGFWLGFTDLGQIKLKDVQELRETFPNNILFVSLEPFMKWNKEIIKLVDWVIVGGWSGRSFDENKIHELFYIIDSCLASGKPIFIKNNISSDILKDIGVIKRLQDYPI